MMIKTTVVRKLPQTTEINNTHLRALVFWAATGVSKSTSGSYGGIIEDVIQSYAKTLKLGIRKVAFKKVT